jgi:SAM-dependent methyltransferase/uncharacterized protein YbaR (Trm112 family)
MSRVEPLDPWYLEHLVCPRDQQRLQPSCAALTCPAGHSYPVVEGVPIMLLDDATHTIEVAPRSIASAVRGPEQDSLYLDTLSLSDEERRGIAELARRGSRIDPVVTYLVAATNGLMYRHLIGSLDRYPIPPLPMPPGAGRRLLDVGCSWGRWTVAASQRGYDAVGIDPSLGAVMAARRAARQLGSPARYVVGDARHLPFATGVFDAVYSYSVIQHFSRADAAQAVSAMGRVLAPGGMAAVQMPTVFGLRCLYHQARRRFREPGGFEVRYWSLPALRQLFTQAVGPVRFEVDGYFGIGLQPSDRPLMPSRLAMVLSVSEALKSVSVYLPPLAWLADSVIVHATKGEEL